MLREIGLSASMLCADPGDLEGDIRQINEARVSLMHTDIMDGHFVPNMTGGLDVADCIRSLAAAPCDFHLMVEDPADLIDDLQLRPGERLAFHIENDVDTEACIRRIQSSGALAGLAVNPGTPVSRVEPFMDKLDFLLVLIVNPGFKGQPVIPRTLEKLRLLRKLRDSRGLPLRFLVDGAVTPENLIEIVEAGADDIVCGPYTCFNKALGGIGPTLGLVKSILREHGYSTIETGGAAL